MEGVVLRVKNEGSGVKGGGVVLHLFKSEEWRVGSEEGGGMIIINLFKSEIPLVTEGCMQIS